MEFLLIVLISSLASHSYAQSGVFTVNCNPLTIQRADPILFPGGVSPHVHVVVGGTAFQKTESNQQAIDSKATTCDKFLDKSNYWQPQLYYQSPNRTFSLVKMQNVAAYYLNRACDYSLHLKSCNSTKYAIAPPAGLRMVTGNPMLRTFDATVPAQRAISHECLKANTSSRYNSLPPEPCLRLRSQVFFPSCWDGHTLDPPDHYTHMAYPAIGEYNKGVCPSSHPVAIYSLFLEFFYDTSKIQNYSRLVYSMGDPTGFGLHADFINGWTNQTALERAMATCTGPHGVLDKSCSLNDGPNGPGRASNQRVEVEPLRENVGLNGTIDALPGNNPIVGRLVRRWAKSLRV